ncbi:unnamed protein product, partial [Sphacelaria rigidula]
EPSSYSAACSSQYSDVWMDATKIDFDGLMVAGMFLEVTGIPEGCNIVDAKWWYEWTGDSHDMIDRSKVHMVVMGYCYGGCRLYM